MIYVTFAISDTMFADGAVCYKSTLTADEFKKVMDLNADSLVIAVNPSHKSTLEAIQRRYGITMTLPDRAPLIKVTSGDYILVIQASLPRIAEGEIHSQSTVFNANFSFSMWSIGR